MSEQNETVREAEQQAAEEKEQQASEKTEQPTAEKTGRKKKKEKVKKSLGREILGWVLTIVVAVAAALVIRSVIFELVRVDGGSMKNTLENGEVMFVSKFDYSSTWLSLPFQSNNAVERAPRIAFGDPNRLDVVICRYPGRGGVNFVKRIVGMPGETILLNNDGYLCIRETEEKNGSIIYKDYQITAESEIDGITDEYRQGAGAFGPYYVPKKGDKVVLRGVLKMKSLLDGTVREDVSLEINGAEWERSRTCIVINADGKTLKIYHRNTDEGSTQQREYDETSGKRLIELETVVSYDGKVYKPSEFYSAHKELFDVELELNEDYYFVMGDHRNDSNDSRYVGALERSAIIGHARSVVLPLGKWRGVE